MRLFLDTDVMLDLLTGRQPHFSPATALFMKVQAGELTACTSATAFVNVHYILRNVGGDEALRLLRQLKVLVTVVPTSDQAVEAALGSRFSDFEDAVQHYTAIEHRVDTLVTRNKKDFRAVSLSVLSPAEVLAGDAWEL